MNLQIECSEDYRETENVTREAFWNHYSPGCSEHYVVHVMRDCPAFVKELDFIAENDNQIVGNVVYLRSVIRGDDGKEYEALTLGPISVLPKYQGKGIGGRLIEHTKKVARKMGFCAILLMGDPAYYSKQGFISAEKLGIRTEDNMYAAALQVCELYEDALRDAKGRYIENSIYEVNDAAVAEFDKDFPIKEKINGTPAQKRFLEIALMRKSVVSI